MRPRALVAAIAMLGLALVALGVSAAQYRADPFAATPISDALSYDRWARRIAAHGVGAEPVFHQSPLFPIVLSATYPADAAPGVPASARALQAGLTALAIAMLVPIGRLYFDSTRAGVAASAIALLYGPIAFHGLSLTPVPLAIATQGAALAAIGAARRRPGAVAALAAGAATGLACLARAEILAFVPIAAAAVATASGAGRRRRAATFGVVLLAAAAAIAPATLHNLRRGDRVLVASSGGENLYIGNRRGGDGGYAAIHPKAGDLFSARELARRLAERDAGRSLTPSEVSSYWALRAVDEIAGDPVAWLGLEGRKLGRLLALGDPSDLYSFPLERERYLGALRLLFLPTGALLVLGAAGLGLAVASAPRRCWPLVAFVALQAAVLLAFFVSTRLRLPWLYALAPFAGLAVAEGAARWRAGAGRAAIAAVAVLALGLGAASVRLERPSPRDRVRLAAVLSIQGRLDEGLAVLEPDLTGPAPSGLALDEAGWLRQRRGDWAEAAKDYRRALDAGLPPGREGSTRTRLAVALERLGRIEDAGAMHDLAAASPEADAGTFYERGLYLERRGRRAEAAADLRRAAEIDPGWAAPREALAALEPD